VWVQQSATAGADLGGAEQEAVARNPVVLNNVLEVTGAEKLCPEKASVLGPWRVIGQEYPEISCRAIDIEFPASGSGQEEKLLGYLLAEVGASCSEQVVAYRGSYRWVQVIEEVSQDPLEAKRELPHHRWTR